MLNLIPMPYRFAIIAVIVLMMCGYSYYKGVSNEKLAFDQFKMEQQVLADVQKAHTAAVIKAQLQITEEHDDAYLKKIGDINKYWAGKLRESSRNTGTGLPPIPGSPGGIDEIPADALSLANQCAIATQQLIDLQGWISKQQQVMN